MEWFPKNDYNKGYGKPEGVVVHETANASSTIYGEINYMKANYNNAFVHSLWMPLTLLTLPIQIICHGVLGIQEQQICQFEQIEVHSKSAFAHKLPMQLGIQLIC